MTKFWRNYALFWVSTLLILCGDLWTKSWITDRLPTGSYWQGQTVEVIPSWLYWVHVHNTGAAWGMLSGNSWLLAILAVIAILSLWFFRRFIHWNSRLTQIAIGLILGGILGNLYDRMTYGYVIDFIDVHLPFYRWPAFNIADCGICVGAILYCFTPAYKKP